MDDTRDLRERVTLLEQRVSRLQADLDVGLSRRFTEVDQLRERVEQQVESLSRRVTRLERRA